MLKITGKKFRVTSAMVLAVLGALIVLVAPAAGQGGFICGSGPFFVQNEDAKVFRHFLPINSSFTFTEGIGEYPGVELNNMGFRKTPTGGLLYAVELTPWGNLGLVTIDSAGVLTHLGSPVSLPASERFDAGDVSLDGATMYINRAGLASSFYTVDLTASPLQATKVNIVGATGFVHDWAYNPENGNLYGADTDGQIAKLDLSDLNTGTVRRTDTPIEGLPAGTAYGAAWFDQERLLEVQRNDGSIFTIDLSGPEIVKARPHGGSSSSRNDGAACQFEDLPEALFRAKGLSDCEVLENICRDLGGTFYLVPEIILECLCFGPI